MSAVMKQEPGAVAQMQDGTTLLAVISRAAADPQCDIEKMERLLAMHERMGAKQAEQAFNEAMNAAQAETRRVAADANNPQTRSNYATYAALDRALRPVYTAHGFSLSFDTGEAAPEGFVCVLAYVSHKAGHTRTYRALMPADGKGAKGGDVMTKTHAFGAASSYGMRYLLKMIFNVAVGEDDDDGNLGAGTRAPMTEDHQATIQAKCEEIKPTMLATVLKSYKAASLAEIADSEYESIIKRLNATLKAKS